MTSEELEILITINELVEAEHGAMVNLDSKLVDADLDSFGYTVFFIDLDEKYGCYSKEDAMNVNYNTITIRDIVNRVVSCK